jgi:hypothetical protein
MAAISPDPRLLTLDSYLWHPSQNRSRYRYWSSKQCRSWRLWKRLLRRSPSACSCPRCSAGPRHPLLYYKSRPGWSSSLLCTAGGTFWWPHRAGTQQSGDGLRSRAAGSWPCRPRSRRRPSRHWTSTARRCPACLTPGWPRSPRPCSWWTCSAGPAGRSPRCRWSCRWTSSRPCS